MSKKNFKFGTFVLGIVVLLHLEVVMAISDTYKPITTYNAVTSDWVTEYQTAINYDGWNDLIYLIGDISSNAKFVKGLTYFRIHPFFPAVPDATEWDDQYYADEYGVMYIDDIELVEFYGIK